MFKVNNRNTRKRLGICSKLTIKTPERLRRRSSVFIGNFEHISHLFIVFYCWLWTRKCKLRSFQFCVNMSLIIKKFWKCFSQNQLLSKKEKEKLDFSCIILKNGQTYFENLAVWRPQVFQSMFGHFSILGLSYSDETQQNFLINKIFSFNTKSLFIKVE